MGMAVLAAVPIFSLILIRLFWSGSSLWFLTVGIILLGAAAVVFLARRNTERQYGGQLAPEQSRMPLVLAGLGVLFLAMLILPNFAESDSTPTSTVPEVQDDASELPASSSELPASEEPETREVVPQDSIATNPETGTADTTDNTGATGNGTTGTIDTTDTTEVPAGSTTYIVQDGDTLWDVSVQFGVSVEAIVAANGLADETAISIDQELIIPAAESGDETVG